MSSTEPICHIITPVGSLGYGFDNNGLHTLLRQLGASATPTALILNSSPEATRVPGGSSGGIPAGLRASYLRDVRKLLRYVGSYRIPLILNALFADGRDDQFRTMSEIVAEAAEGSSQNPKVTIVPSAGLQSPQSGQYSEVESSASAGLERRISPRTIGEVVQTFMETAEANPGYEVMLGSSSSRIVPFVAFASLCLKNSHVPVDQSPASATRVKGGVLHLTKVIEEGGVCAAPKCAGAMGTLYNDGSFDVCPIGAKSHCTSISVASYVLQSPGRLDVPEVGGRLDLTEVSYRQLPDGKSIRVRGSVLRRDTGSERRGREHLQRPYHSVYIGRITDESLINTIDQILMQVVGYVRAQQPRFPDHSWNLDFSVYGRNTPEMIVAGEITAIDYETTRTIAEIARMATQLGFGLANRNVVFSDASIIVTERSSHLR